MSKLRIFIEGEELDTLESVTIPITKQYEELGDPTVICNDFSKTVTVPLSAHNNAVFGHAYRPDRVTATADDVPLVGIYFNPYQKLTCRVQWGDDVIMQGYAKMLRVTQSGYEVTINGELGKVFQELKKLTFKASEADSGKYLIDGSAYVKETLNRDLVAKCWAKERNGSQILRAKSDYDVANIIGFLPCNAYADNFDYTTIGYADGTTKSFEDILNGISWETKTGISVDSIIGEGIRPEAALQYRSYNCVPFIYWDCFWQIMAREGERLTGYKWVKDTPTVDTMTKNLAVVLNGRDDIVGSDKAQTYDGLVVYTQGGSPVDLVGESYPIACSVQGMEGVSGSVIPNDGRYIKLHVVPQLDFTVAKAETLGKYNELRIAGGYGHYPWEAAFVWELLCNGESIGTQIFIDSGELSDTFLNQLKAAYPNAIYYKDTRKSGTYGTAAGTYNYKISGTEMICTIPPEVQDADLSVRLTSVVYDYSGTYGTPDTFLIFGNSDEIGFGRPTTITQGETQLLTSNEWVKTEYRTGSNFTLNTICSLNFDTVLDFCKRYRIAVSVDEPTKELRFSDHYFDGYSIKDMTDSVDNTSFEVEPIAFEHSKVLFTYADDDTAIGSTYSDTYGYPYGAKALKTNYNFTTDEQTLFEGQPATIPYSPSVIPTLQFAVYKYDAYLFKNEFMVFADSDGKYVSRAGAFFFPSRAEAALPPITITGVCIDDDSAYMTAMGTYCYNYGNEQTISKYITECSLVQGDYLCAFNTPLECYTYKPKEYNDKQGVFAAIWQAYLDERYNVQNKRVTCKVRLSPLDFMQFDFTQLWKIGSVLYMVNKISDYDVTGDGLTEVELITIQDINGYL
jgi:hypothetical protein